MKLSTVPVYYVAMIIEALVEKGWDEEKLIGKISFPADLLQEKLARIPSSEFARFVSYLSVKQQDECFGLLDSAMNIGTFTLLYRSCINCDNLGHFLGRFAKSMKATNASVELALSRDEKFAIFSIACHGPENDAKSILLMMMLAIAHRSSSWVIDQKIGLHEVNLTSKAPSYAQDYHMLFKSAIEFKQEQNSIRFSAHYLDEPVSRDEQALSAFLKDSALLLMSELELDSSLTSQIRTLIKSDVAGDFPSFVGLAESMNYTSATLRRRLRSEGTTYQEIKDAVRRDAAIHYLSKQTMSVEEVAEKAGFSEPTSFFRAFKRWTGTSPRAYVAVG